MDVFGAQRDVIKWGFPQIRGTSEGVYRGYIRVIDGYMGLRVPHMDLFFGVSIIGIPIFGGLYSGPPLEGNYQIVNDISTHLPVL